MRILRKSNGKGSLFHQEVSYVRDRLYFYYAIRTRTCSKMLPNLIEAAVILWYGESIPNIAHVVRNFCFVVVIFIDRCNRSTLVSSFTPKVEVN